MEIYPWTEEGTKYGYTMMAIISTIISAAWLQYTGAWLPFVVSCVWAGLIFYDLYLVDFLHGPELSEEEKALQAQTKFVTDSMGSDAKKARRERLELQKAVKEANRMKREMEAMNGKE